jgi:hypothetical protein
MIGIVVFLGSTLMIGGVCEGLAALGARGFLERLEKQTAQALEDLQPFRIWDRYQELSKPDCSGAESLAEAQRCLELRGNLIVRAPLGLYRVMRETFAKSAVSMVIDLMQLAAGFAAATALMLWLKPKGYGAAVPFAVVVFAMMFTVLLSWPMLLIIKLGSATLGNLIATSVLPIFGGTWTGFLTALVGKSIDDQLHERAGRGLRALLGERNE